MFNKSEITAETCFLFVVYTAFTGRDLESPCTLQRLPASEKSMEQEMGFITLRVSGKALYANMRLILKFEPLMWNRHGRQ